MTQLTKEQLDASLKHLSTKDDIAGLQAHVDTEIIGLRKEINENFHGVDLKLDAIYQLLDVRQRVEKLEKLVADLAARL